MKPANTAVSGRLDHTEGAGLSDGHRQGGNRHLGVAFQVKTHHLPHIHAIDMVGTEDRHQLRLELLDEVEILKYGIRRSLKPSGAFTHLRRHHSNELLGKDRCQSP